MLLIGNILSFVALIILLLAISKKENKELIKLQGFSHVFFALSGLFLKGYSGFVQDSVGAIRNYLIYTNRNSKVSKMLLVLVGMILGILLNNKGFIGILPILGTFQYTLISTNTSNIKIVKCSIIVNSILMVFYSITINNYVNILTDLIVIFITINDIKKY